MSVVLNDNATTATAVVPEGCDPAGVTLERLSTLARERGIDVNAAVTAALSAIVADFHEQPRALSRVFARAKRARHGRNGAFELEAKFLQGDEVDLDSLTPVDHYERRAYRRAAKGERIGTITPPTPGVDGRDLTGRTLRASDGRPCPVHLDSELLVSSDGSVRAPYDGILVVERARVRVSPVFDVPGSVDFSTGNIEFAGSVHVRGEVRDRFRVTVGENLIVDGAIEAASVRCGGDLHARIGMAGRGLGRLLVRGDVRAGYLNAVSGAVTGTLDVLREIRASTLTIGGDLLMPRGAVVGGTLSVSGGMDVGVLGSPAGAHTTIKLGAVPFLDNSARKVSRQIDALTVQRDALLPHLQVLDQADMTLSPTDEARRQVLTDRLACIDAEADRLRAELEQVQTLIAAGADVRLRVGSLIHPNVRLCIDDRVIGFIRECKGPVHIGLDLDRQPVLRMGDGPLRPMDLYARFVTVQQQPKAA